MGHLTPLRTLATVCCLASACAATQAAAADAGERMLNSTARVADAAVPKLAQRGTGVSGTFNPSALKAAQLSVTLPDGRTITAQRQRTAEDAGKGRKSWLGTFPEQPGSLLSVTTYRGVTTGFLTYGAETWDLLPATGGKHLFYRVDDKRLPATEPEAVSATDDRDVAGTTATAAAATTTATGGYVHDLLVLYTPAAKAAYGQATLESMIQNAVSAANQAYLNSRISITLNLVGLQEVAYVETGDVQTSLNDLRGTADGKIDQVHQVRNQLGADIVSMISKDTSACGIGGVLTTLSTSSASNAFNVVQAGCLSQHSLAHEIGHNQGNKHDRESTTGSGAYPYSYGFRRCVSDGTGFRTVMAYSCTGASRVAWFSNPNAYYNGYATGIAYESNPAGSADNARSMNETAPIVAAFRAAAAAAAPAPSAPAAPAGLASTSVAYNSVAVKWTDTSGNESGFRLERSANGVDYAEIASLGAGAVSHVDNGVTARSNYFYRVRSYNSVGNSAYSNGLSVTTSAAPPAPPAAPNSVSARNGSDGSAAVSWVDGSTNESNFEVRRETWDAKRKVWKTPTVVATVPANVVSVVDLTGNGTFRYSVRALNSGGGSASVGPAAVTVTGAAAATGKGPRK